MREPSHAQSDAMLNRAVVGCRGDRRPSRAIAVLCRARTRRRGRRDARRPGRRGRSSSVFAVYRARPRRPRATTWRDLRVRSPIAVARVGRRRGVRAVHRDAPGARLPARLGDRRRSTRARSSRTVLVVARACRRAAIGAVSTTPASSRARARRALVRLRSPSACGSRASPSTARSATATDRRAAAPPRAELAALQPRSRASPSERERLARDIHDTLAQSLTGLVMLAERGRAARGVTATPRHAARARRRARSSRWRARRSPRPARSSPRSRRCRRSAARRRLDRLARRFERETGVARRCRAAGRAAPLDREPRSCCCAVAQEALANVRKHAAADAGRRHAGRLRRRRGRARGARRRPGFDARRRARRASGSTACATGGARRRHTRVRARRRQRAAAPRASRCRDRWLTAPDDPLRSSSPTTTPSCGPESSRCCRRAPASRSWARQPTAPRPCALAAATAPDVVLMDLRMPASTASRPPRASSAEAGAPRVLILTTYETDDQILAAIEAGASGYLLKAAPQAEILARHPLRRRAASPRSRRRSRRGSSSGCGARAAHGRAHAARARGAAARRDGRSNTEIARTLFIGEATVKTHLLQVFEKLGVSDRTRAVTRAMELGLL